MMGTIKMWNQNPRKNCFLFWEVGGEGDLGVDPLSPPLLRLATTPPLYRGAGQSLCEKSEKSENRRFGGEILGMFGIIQGMLQFVILKKPTN